MLRHLCIALLGILALAPTGQAQSAEPVALLTDPAGDVMLHSEIPPSEVPVPRPDIDFLGLDVAETPGEILVFLRLASLHDPDDGSQKPDGMFTVWFEAAGTPLSVWIPYSPSNGAYEAHLQSADGSEDLADLQLDVVPRLSAFVAHIPRGVLADAIDGQAAKGVSLAGWRAEALALRTIKQDSWLGDDINMDLADPVEFVLSYGTPQSGPIQLSSPSPYVVSNGLATSYPMKLFVSNTKAQASDIHLRAADVPSGWQVTLPSSAIHLDPGKANITFVLTVPFRHQHGGLDQFVVEAVEGTTVQASLDMGIVYTAIPQPAGHHNTLYIHSGVTGPYMNTLSEDEADTGEPYTKGPLDPGAVWRIPLEPNLASGLDFDLARTGTITVAFANRAPSQGMQLTGGLRVTGGGADLAVASLAFANSPDGQAMQQTQFTGTVAPLPEADLLPFTPGMQLVLDLELTDAAEQAITFLPPSLLPGGELVLPLFDYHDDIDGALATISGLAWNRTTVQVRAPPGGLAVVPLTLEALDGATHAVRIQVDSNPEGITQYRGEDLLVVKPSQRASGTVVVNVPGDAFDGQLLDAVVVAEDQAGSGALAVSRIAIVVDRTAPSGVDAGQAMEKESPSPLFAVLGAMAIALLASRRRT
jgi:hypothetical protein